MASDRADTDPASTSAAKDLDPNRREWMVVPALGGNTDIGFQFGATFHMAQFDPEVRPFRWRIDAVSAMSVKDDYRGFRPVQQYHVARFDIPDFFDPSVRAEFRLNFNRAVDFSWHGIGNHTGSDSRPPPPDAANANQYLSENFRTRALFRIKVKEKFEVALVTHLRYEFPDTYPGTTLLDDLASGRAIGKDPMFIETVGAGIYLDRRDNEFVPASGYYYQLGLAETVGSRDDVRYGEASVTLSHYMPLGTKNLVFATRMIGSWRFGSIPYYDLQTGGVFDPQFLVGGERGIRGVPQGRYAGPLKAINNNELRATPIKAFNVIGKKLRPGFLAYFDAGRVFSKFAYAQANDGHEIALKYSVGGGFFFQWDQISVFRVEAAYSPDTYTGHGDPLFFYFSNGILF